jgi:antitoxin component of RelBE/YafQ-DinJ toxin-antitoxin module
MSKPTHQLNVRLSPDELARFERVAKRFGLNVQSMLKMLVKRIDDARTLDDVKTLTKLTEWKTP